MYIQLQATAVDAPPRKSIRPLRDTQVPEFARVQAGLQARNARARAPRVARSDAGTRLFMNRIMKLRRNSISIRTFDPIRLNRSPREESAPRNCRDFIWTQLTTKTKAHTRHNSQVPGVACGVHVDHELHEPFAIAESTTFHTNCCERIDRRTCLAALPKASKDQGRVCVVERSLLVAQKPAVRPRHTRRLHSRRRRVQTEG